MFPANVLDALLPEVVRGQARADHERWRRRNPDARPWIRTTVWQVPVRWFVLFRDEEREYAAADGEGGEPVLRYRTPMVEARRRLARGLRTLRENVAEGPLTEGLVEVGRWLEEFHPRSLVELDYGGLVHALSAEQLAGDRSAADVAEGSPRSATVTARGPGRPTRGSRSGGGRSATASSPTDRPVLPAGSPAHRRVPLPRSPIDVKRPTAASTGRNRGILHPGRTGRSNGREGGKREPGRGAGRIAWAEATKES